MLLHCWNVWTLVVGLVVMTSLCEGCSQPMGWRSLPMSDRLDMADLVVQARILSVGEAERNKKPVEMEVMCVLKDVDRVSVPGQITVDQDWPPLCVNNLVNIVEGNVSMVMLARDPEAPEAHYRFSNKNVQGAVFDGHTVNIPQRCDFRRASLPTGPSERSSCPNFDGMTECRGPPITAAAATASFQMVTLALCVLYRCIF